jgi:starch synthase
VANGTATGFQFEAYNASVMEGALRRAVETYWDGQPTWRALVETGMKQDWSWSASARQYVDVYANAIRQRQLERERLKLR